jgi:molecular chaperone DnaK (HSP70)
VKYALGVDLGTTALAAATFSNGQGQVVHLGGEGRPSVPSVAPICAEDPDLWLVGTAAMESAAADPSRAARYPKRDLGREHPLLIGGVDVRPEQILALQLRTVVNTVIDARGDVPAHRKVTIRRSGANTNSEFFAM